jgi:large subunit ribosomal protein L30
MASKLEIVQVRSPNGSSQKQRDSLRTLGLGRIGKRVEREDGPVVRGLVQSVRHLVEVEGSSS